MNISEISEKVSLAIKETYPDFKLSQFVEIIRRVVDNNESLDLLISILRFCSRLKVHPSGCWTIGGSLMKNGYSKLSIRDYSRSKEYLAHRFSYELFVGKIHDGLDIDHLCRNRACCNFNHLEPVTRRENTLRGVSISAINSKKTHCAYGHQLTEDNLVKLPSKYGRRCAKCHIKREKQYYERRKNELL